MHSVHAVRPVSEYFPQKHRLQADVPTEFLNFPAAHMTHGVPVYPIAHVASASPPPAATSTTSTARASPPRHALAAPHIHVQLRACSGQLL